MRCDILCCPCLFYYLFGGLVITIFALLEFLFQRLIYVQKAPVSIRILRLKLINSNQRAPAFKKKRVAPDAFHFGDELAFSNLPKPARVVQGNAGRILRKDAGLQRPNPVSLGFLHQRLKQ
jgi:hypothetical protein